MEAATSSENMAASSSSTVKCENIHSGFSSESDSDISDWGWNRKWVWNSSDGEASFTDNLQNIDW